MLGRITKETIYAPFNFFIAYLIARERITSGSIESAVKNAMKKLKGAYSLLVMSPNKLIAARDKWGFRPLQMGKRDDAVVFASETCAFDAIDAEFVRDIAPGEIVTIEAARDGGDGYFMTEDTELCDSVPSSMCIFEHIYFARPDSTIENEVVHECRKRAGAFLVHKHNKHDLLLQGRRKKNHIRNHLP